MWPRSVGVVDDPTVSPELRPVIPQRVTRHSSHRSSPSHARFHPRGQAQTSPRILRHVPAAKKDESPFRAERISSRMNSTSRFQFTEKQTSPSRDDRNRWCGRVSSGDHDLQRSAIRLQNRRDQFKPKGGGPRMEPSLR